MAGAKKPNILVIMSDDIGTCNISAYHRAMMGGPILGPRGEYWTQRKSDDGNGHHCIMGAVRTNGHTAVSCERSGYQFQRGKTQ